LWTSATPVPVESRGASTVDVSFDHAVDAAKTMEEAEEVDEDTVDNGVVPEILTEAPEANVSDSETSGTSKSD
jgi:hypothetical protein